MAFKSLKPKDIEIIASITNNKDFLSIYGLNNKMVDIKNCVTSTN